MWAGKYLEHDVAIKKMFKGAEESQDAVAFVNPEVRCPYDAPAARLHGHCALYARSPLRRAAENVRALSRHLQVKNMMRLSRHPRLVMFWA